MFQGEQGEKINWCAALAAAGRSIIMKKYCTKCGKPFESIGREVICPACKAQAAAESKKAAVLRAKAASWAGESVPVRISGRASTVIRSYAAANNLRFAAALDEILKASGFRQSVGGTWEDITPYKSHRRDKNTQDAPQDAPQTAQDAPQTAQEVKQEVQAAKESKTVKTAKMASKASKTVKK